jgi:hypothetical protein
MCDTDLVCGWGGHLNLTVNNDAVSARALLMKTYLLYLLR